MLGFGLLLGALLRPAGGCGLPCGVLVAGPGGVLTGQELGGVRPAGDRRVTGQGGDPLVGCAEARLGGLGLQSQPVHVGAPGRDDHRLRGG